MRIPLFGMVVLLSAPALAEEVAVLPISAGGALAETAFGIETALRREAEGNHGATILDRDTTSARITGAESAGVKCSTTDAACLKDLGDLCTFSEMIVPELKTVSTDGAVLWIGVFDVATGTFKGRAEGKVALQQPQRQADVRRILRKALGLPDEAYSTVETPGPGPETGTPSTGNPPTESVEIMGGGEPEQPPETSSIIPIVLLGVGGATGVTALIAAGVATGIYIFAWNAGANGSDPLATKYANAQLYSTLIAAVAVAAGIAAAGTVVLVGTGAAMFAAEFE